MATRSPNAFHAYWGIFATGADLPNVAGSTTQSSALETGDQAYSSSDQLLYFCTDATLGAATWSATISSAASLTVTQANTYSDGQAVYFDGANWLLADASNAAKLGLGILSAVAPTGFVVNLSGPLSSLPGPYTPGQYYFVSPSTPGSLTTVEPSTSGQYSNPLFFALSNTSGIVLPFRPSEVGSSSSGAQISVATLTALTLYPDVGLPEGTLAYVRNLRSYFRLGVLTVGVPMVIVTANSAAASWYRLDEADYSWSLQSAWEINSVTGTDGATGAPGSPIQTWAEFKRRVKVLNTSMVVTFVNSPSSGLVGAFSRGTNTAITLTLRGTPLSVLATGTFTLASSQVPYTGGTNVQGKIAASFSFTNAHIGKLVRATIGGTTYYAPVLSLDVTRANTTWWTTTTGPTTSQPANLSTIDVLDLPVVDTVQIETDGFLVRVELFRLTSTNIRDTPYISTNLYNEIISPSDYYGFYACEFATSGVASGPGDGSYVTACSITAANQDDLFKIVPQGGTLFFVGGGSRRLITNNDVAGRASFVGFMVDGRLLGFGATISTAGVFADSPDQTYPLALFNSNSYALIIRGTATSFRAATLIGATSSAVAAVLIDRGASLAITGAGSPLITNSTALIDLDMDTASGVAANSYVPITAGVPTGPASLCRTWAVWAGATFNRHVVNLQSGSKIVGT